MMNSTLFYGSIIALALIPSLLSTLGHIKQRRLLQQQLDQHSAYLESLQVGDEVILLSGIHGKILSIKENLITLQVADSVAIYIEKESIMGKTKELLFQ